MPRLIQPTRVPGIGDKAIDEYVGRVNTRTAALSIARMDSPAGWTEPGQRPGFDEYTLVLSGRLHVEHQGGALDVEVGQAVLAAAGEWVRYSTPEGATYVAVCLPAFSPELARRDTA